MTETLQEYLFETADGVATLDISQSTEALDVSPSVTENDPLHERLQPSLGYRDQLVQWFRADGEFNQVVVAIGLTTGLLAAGVFRLVAPQLDSFRITLYVVGYNLLSGSLSTLSAQTAVAGVAGLAGAVALTTIILGVLRRKAAPPPHGQPLSLVLTTPGDGTSDSRYILPDTVVPTFEEAINQAMPGAELSPATTTHGERLGLPVHGEESKPTATAATDRTPFVAEITYREGVPFDALAEGPRTETLLDRDADDAGLLPTALLSLITNYEVPILIQITTTARQSEASRKERVDRQLERLLFPATTDIEDGHSTEESQTPNRSLESMPETRTGASSETDRLPSLTHLYDVSIQLLVFDSASDGTIAETVCRDVAAAVKGVLPDGVETVDYRLARADASGYVGQSSRWRSRRLLSRLGNREVPVAGAYRLYGLKAALGVHERTAIPVTSRELLSYILVAGKSTPRADRSQGTKTRDATPIKRPAETRMASLRWGDSWRTFVDGGRDASGPETTLPTDRSQRVDTLRSAVPRDTDDPE